MLKSLFKQPYKIVKFDVFFILDLYGYNYYPTDYLLKNPDPIGQNVFMFPEEKNVRVKKIKATFIKNTGFNSYPLTMKNWVVNYQLLNRTDGFISDYPTRVTNPSSGDFQVPGTKPVFMGVVNTSHPLNDFGPGILAGGIRVDSISALGTDRFSGFGGNISMTLTVYYQDED
jgi:hypothetical protein